MKSSAVLLCAVIALMAAWHHAIGAIAADRVTSRKDEVFDWVTVLVSNTLGTAHGDLVATTTGLGFEGGWLSAGSPSPS